MSEKIITQFDHHELVVREAEKARRRRRFEERLGAVHKRRNAKNRPREALNSNSKRGQQWRRDAEA